MNRIACTASCVQRFVYVRMVHKWNGFSENLPNCFPCRLSVNESSGKIFRRMLVEYDV